MEMMHVNINMAVDNKIFFIIFLFLVGYFFYIFGLMVYSSTDDVGAEEFSPSEFSGKST
jgi:hypothetical protein